MFSSALVEKIVLSCGTMPTRWRNARALLVHRHAVDQHAAVFTS